MAIVQLTSTNPEFSYIIRKNPATGMMLRTIRQGTAFGWYSEEQIYNVYFKDADNEISYKQNKEENFEYLNVSRYNTPLFALNAISEFFISPLKLQHEKDIAGYQHQFVIHLVHIEYPRYVDFFIQHVQDYEFELESIAYKSYSLKIKTQKSLHDLLNMANLISLFLSIIGKEYVDVTESLVAKYIQNINVVDAPFYIRYLFTRNVLTSKHLFYTFKDEIEKTDRYTIQFAYGNTSQQRRAAIMGWLPLNKSIVDIGCGEGFYALPLAKKVENKDYYAIDIDEEKIEKLHWKLEKNELDHVYTFLSLESFLEEYNKDLVDVLLTEVIEHMSLTEAEQFIRTICEHISFHTFVITTPNRDFNPFYALEEFRHEDHKWEMGEKEFRTWIEGMFCDDEVDLEFVGIGDCVNGISTTQGVVIRSREGDATCK
ncbi:class I SAM-dependent methyltransferase [Caldalkalibacillus mannanilyticus]|uniref:class I SAM-dependent methyltransferase n=1 Tax=Caldalkalibacillus mannanilyticus TaxID=1418 RepID=UPI0004698732|nr:methyltransferase domain-containing protein [Caldalkalibacillus mannanilyticus]